MLTGKAFFKNKKKGKCAALRTDVLGDFHLIYQQGNCYQDKTISQKIVKIIQSEH